MQVEKCQNCSSEENVVKKLIFPEEAGGNINVASNWLVLCRPCRLAREAITKMPVADERRPINIWMTHEFHKQLQDKLKVKPGFNSMGALIRFLMDQYIDDPESFKNLEQYQLAGSDIKINVWVNTTRYSIFKKLVEQENSSVAEKVKSLISMFFEETADLFK